MSTEMLAQVLRLSNPLLSRPQKNLLLVLAYHTNRETGLAYPGHRLLSQELMITTRQVRNLVHQVEKAGWVEVRRGQGRGHLTVYRLKLDPEEVIPRKGEMVYAPSSEKRGNPAPEKGKSAAEKGKSTVTPIYEVEREKKEMETGLAPVQSRRGTYSQCPLCGVHHQPGPCRDPWEARQSTPMPRRLAPRIS